MKKLLKKNQKGFTLIEIIAVLVILGILAAVAIPKYFAMQNEARNKAVQAALGEAKARVLQYASQYLLQNGSWPGAYTTLSTDGGDFTFAYTYGASTMTVGATGNTAVFGGSPPSSSVTMTTPGTT
jgi:prepilin-type N-terminal cleavage/methylation domain-containing protein